MNDSLIPGTPQWERRMYVHRHNSLHGKVECIRVFAAKIGECESVNDRTTELCIEIMEKCDALRAALKTRIDP